MSIQRSKYGPVTGEWPGKNVAVQIFTADHSHSESYDKFCKCFTAL